MGSGTSGRRWRVLALPVLLIAVGTYAVHTADRPAKTPPVVTATPETLPPPEPLGELWAAWGSDLTAGDGRYPVLLGALNRDEALYVLLSVRAAQVAQAVAQAGPQAGIDAALEEAGLSPQPAIVPATGVPERPGCVVLTLADDPYGRSYFGWAAAPSEPGPSPLSQVEGVLLRTARVGLPATDAATCGRPVAYSPTAQEALKELSPALLR